MNQTSSKKTANIFQASEHEKSIKDETYPSYHLRAPSGWVNDPCGLFYFNSSFHVFMQSNPWGKDWGDMSWSHIVSHPNYKVDFKWFYPLDENGVVKTTAIIPSLDERAADRNGIFTGCVKMIPYEDNGNGISYYPTAFYSAVWGDNEDTQETVCIARALDANKLDSSNKIIDPYLTNWTKYSLDDNQDNPKVILNQPKELNLVSFRDPFVFNLPNDSNYYMLMSAGIIDKRNNPKGVVLCFKNNGQDITKGWERVNSKKEFFFEGKVFHKDSVSNGGNFECVCMFRLTDHIGAMNSTPYILIFSQDGSHEKNYARSLYYVLGSIVKTQEGMYFEVLSSFKDINGNIKYQLLDLCPDFIYYAANVMPIDSEKRNILMAWLNIKSASQKESNWAGALALPRFLFVYKNINEEWCLGQEVALIQSLKGQLIFSEKTKLIQNEKLWIRGVNDRRYTIASEYGSSRLLTQEFGLKVVVTDTYNMNINIKNGFLNVDGRYKCKLDIDETTNKIGLDVYLDGSSLEIFLSKNIMNGAMVGFATYSTQLKSLRLNDKECEKAYIYADDMEINVKAYSMKSCWISAPKG